jgi:hypothetical protein
MTKPKIKLSRVFCSILHNQAKKINNNVIIQEIFVSYYIIQLSQN